MRFVKFTVYNITKRILRKFRIAHLGIKSIRCFSARHDNIEERFPYSLSRVNTICQPLRLQELVSQFILFQSLCVPPLQPPLYDCVERDEMISHNGPCSGVCQLVVIIEKFVQAKTAQNVTQLTVHL